MTDDQFIPTGLQLTVEIPGIKMEFLKSFTKPELTASTTEEQYFNDQGNTENIFGDVTHVGPTQFSFAVAMPRRDNPIQKWFDDCRAEGNNKHKKDIVIEEMEGDGAITTWNIQGAVPTGISYTAAEAGNASPQVMTVTCRAIKATHLV